MTMAIQPLPGRPNLGQPRRQARDLSDAVRAGEPAVLERIRPYVPGGPVTVSSAQLVIAREHGLPSWSALEAEVEARTVKLAERVNAFPEASVVGRTDHAALPLAYGITAPEAKPERRA
jgi:hypothetical protein